MPQLEKLLYATCSWILATKSFVFSIVIVACLGPKDVGGLYLVK